MRVCLERGCTSLTQRTRCPQHERQREAQRPGREIYDDAWAAESRALRQAQPWCSTCGTTLDLTVDHPTRLVLCRSCHARLENRRRRELVTDARDREDRDRRDRRDRRSSCHGRS